MTDPTSAPTVEREQCLFPAEDRAPEQEPKRLTCLDVIARLRRRHGEAEGRAGVIAEVLDVDLLVVESSTMHGHLIHGYEVKVSRSDWLRELASPTKALRGMALCDRWWLACPPGVARAEELPAGWGMVEVTDKCRVIKRAPVLRPVLDRNARYDPASVPGGDFTWLVPSGAWAARRLIGQLARRVSYAEADRRALIAAWPGTVEARDAALKAGHLASGRIVNPAQRLVTEAMEATDA